MWNGVSWTLMEADTVAQGPPVSAPSRRPFRIRRALFGVGVIVAGMSAGLAAGIAAGVR